MYFCISTYVSFLHEYREDLFFYLGEKNVIASLRVYYDIELIMSYY